MLKYLHAKSIKKEFYVATVHAMLCFSVCVRYYVFVRHLQGSEDGGGDDDEKPEVHVEELTDHIGHVGWKDEQEETQRHCSEVLPQTPGKTDRRGSKREDDQLSLYQHWHFASTHSFNILFLFYRVLAFF